MRTTGSSRPASMVPRVSMKPDCTISTTRSGKGAKFGWLANWAKDAVKPVIQTLFRD